MIDDKRRKQQAQAREFPETMALFGKVRDALAAKMFETTVGQREEREAIFLRVQTLDALTHEMGKLLAEGVSQKAMDAYAEKVATTGK